MNHAQSLLDAAERYASGLLSSEPSLTLTGRGNIVFHATCVQRSVTGIDEGGNTDAQVLGLDVGIPVGIFKVSDTFQYLFPQAHQHT